MAISLGALLTTWGGEGVGGSPEGLPPPSITRTLGSGPQVPSCISCSRHVAARPQLGTKALSFPNDESPALAALEHKGPQVTGSQPVDPFVSFPPQFIVIGLPQLWSCVHCAHNLKVVCAHNCVSFKHLCFNNSIKNNAGSKPALHRRSTTAHCGTVARTSPLATLGFHVKVTRWSDRH